MNSTTKRDHWSDEMKRHMTMKVFEKVYHLYHNQQLIKVPKLVFKIDSAGDDDPYKFICTQNGSNLIVTVDVDQLSDDCPFHLEQGTVSV